MNYVLWWNGSCFGIHSLLILIFHKVGSDRVTCVYYVPYTFLRISINSYSCQGQFKKYQIKCY